MSGVLITSKADATEVNGLLSALAGRMGDLTPAMRVIGETLRVSVLRNFEKGGRPEAWNPLSEFIKRKQGGGVLRRRGMGGGLMGSITWTAGPTSVAVGTNEAEGGTNVAVGTNSVYGATHQFGAKQGAFGKTKRGGPIPWGDIPARPFLVVQDDDWAEIRETLAAFLSGDA